MMSSGGKQTCKFHQFVYKSYGKCINLQVLKKVFEDWNMEMYYVLSMKNMIHAELGIAFGVFPPMYNSMSVCLSLSLCH